MTTAAGCGSPRRRLAVYRPLLVPSRSRVLDRLVTLLNARAVTVDLWHNIAIAVCFVVLTLPTVGLYVMLRNEVRADARRDEAEEAAHREAELGAQKQELLLQQQELTRRLQETDQMKDDLLAMVSHELRNPLTTVLGVFRLFTVGAPLSPAERQEMLEMGERQATRLRNLIEQLLQAATFERGDAGAPASGTESLEVDAAELALQAASEARAGHRDHPIRVECDGSLPVRVAPDAVVQVLGSLLDNACKYSSNQRLVRLLAERDEGYAVLAVEDEGAGIPPADRERVFERFTRLGKDRTGLGLGLFIGRQLARAQGGDLVLVDPRRIDRVPRTLAVGHLQHRFAGDLING